MGVLALAARSADPGEALTRFSIRLCLVWYGAALVIMLWPVAGHLGEAWQRLGRALWTGAYVTYLLHVALAFHFFHHWSHAAAFAHVASQSGFGPGLYFNYAFSLVWGVDVAWWWSGLRRYAKRPRWISVVVHSFMVFIVFNGAVVFASGPVRWASAAGFVGLAALFGWARCKIPRGE
jgi:hypothetical protein